jgi:1-deoxyxylulose-5-phosphate synthase
MKRRDFLAGSVLGLGAAWMGYRSFGHSAPAQPMPIPPGVRFSASDTVTLGDTGIKTSRLAMGTGTVGYGGHSHQTALGMKGLPDLLQNGYDHGLRFFDLADSYGSHPYAAEALKHIPREKITILTKSDTRDAAGMKADIERFRRELNTDYLDIVLMHCMTEGDWTTRFRPVMDVLEEARGKGMIRAHGCSCHTLEALRAAAQSPWVQVDLARVNPIGSHMDADPETVVSVLREMRAAGKAVIGMKILGQGDMRRRQDEALKYSLSLDVLHAFTIGAESRAEQEDLMRRIVAVNA